MDILDPKGPAAPPSTVEEMVKHLLVAFLGGLLVTLIYKGTRPKTHVNPSFPATLVLLAILIAMVTQVIGNNAARAFSLVGVLSIVRFRTIVRDTQDTAFVVFSVVVGMAAGAGAYVVAAWGLLIGGAAAALIRTKYGDWSESENTLNLRLSIGADATALLGPSFDKSVETYEIVSVSTTNKGASMDYVYRIRMKPGFHAAAFVKELNQIEGVQNVELRRGEPEAL